MWKANRKESGLVAFVLPSILELHALGSQAACLPSVRKIESHSGESEMLSTAFSVSQRDIITHFKVYMSESS